MVFSRYTTTNPSKSKRLLDLLNWEGYKAFDMKVLAFALEVCDESGFNQRPRRPVDAAVCHSHDFRAPPNCAVVP